MDWFVYTVLATLAYGLLNFFYKVAVSSGMSSYAILKYQAATVALLSALVFALNNLYMNAAGVFKYVFLFAFLNSLFFFLGASLKLNALRYIPVNIAAPLQKMNTVFVVFIGVFFFKDTLNIYQWVGIFLAVFTLILLSLGEALGKNNNDISRKNWTAGFSMGLAGALCVALSMTAGKLASERVDRIYYMLVSYVLVLIYSFFNQKMYYRHPERRADMRILFLCVIIGILNFAGYYLILKAWSLGPISLIQPVFSLSMLITIVLAKIFYREKFNIYNLIAIATSFLSVYLLKLKL